MFVLFCFVLFCFVLFCFVCFGSVLLFCVVLCSLKSGIYSLDTPHASSDPKSTLISKLEARLDDGTAPFSSTMREFKFRPVLDCPAHVDPLPVDATAFETWQLLWPQTIMEMIFQETLQNHGIKILEMIDGTCEGSSLCFRSSANQRFYLRGAVLLCCLAFIYGNCEAANA